MDFPLFFFFRIRAGTDIEQLAIRIDGKEELVCLAGQDVNYLIEEREIEFAAVAFNTAYPEPLGPVRAVAVQGDKPSDQFSALVARQGNGFSGSQDFFPAPAIVEPIEMAGFFRLA